MIDRKIQIRKESIGRLISTNYFTLPAFQRPYVWKEAQVRRLLADILLAFKEQQSCFLGIMIGVDNGDGRLTLLDGGQRITTLSMLIAAIKDYFLYRGDKDRAAEIERSYLSSRRDLKTMQPVPHVTLSQDNDIFFEEIITHAGTVVSSSVSGQRLRRAANIAAKHIERRAAESTDALDTLIEYLEFIRDRVEVIWLSNSEETDIMTLFDQLTAEGIAFSPEDTLKSYLYSIAGSQTAAVQRAWEEINLLCNFIGIGFLIENTIRSHWLARYGYATKENLLTDIKTRIVTERDAINFCTSLKEDVYRTLALLNSKDASWKSLSPAVKGAIEALNIIGFGVMQPLLLAVAGRYTHQSEKILKKIVVWMVRLKVAGKDQDEQVSQKVSRAAMAFLRKEVHTLQELSAIIDSVIPNNDKFQASFARMRVGENSLARYYLTELEVYARKKISKGAMGYASELMPHSSTDHVNIEHILPQGTEDTEWTQFTAQEKRHYLWRLGNMSLLTAPDNSQIGNSSFSVKKPLYASSDFKLTKDLATYEDWTPSTIEARQKAMAKIALKVWRLS